MQLEMQLDAVKMQLAFLTASKQRKSRNGLPKITLINEQRQSAVTLTGDRRGELPRCHVASR